MENYKQITVREIVDFVEKNKRYFPNGLDTVVVSGDFEGNYLHQMHELGTNGDSGQLYIGYEMHEGGNF